MDEFEPPPGANVHPEGTVNADGSSPELPECGETRTHDWMTFTCSRPPGHDGGHVDRKRRTCWVGDAPATDLEGRPLLHGTVKPPKLDPRAFRRRRLGRDNN